MPKFVIIFLVLISFPLVAGEPVKLIGDVDHQYICPIYSPDGSKIAFTSSNYSGLWIMNSDGRDVHQITTESAAGFGFQWSFDSKAIVSRVAKYEGRYRYNAIKIFDLVNGTEKQVTDYRTMMPGLPKWAEADKKVFMYGKNKLEIFDSGKEASSLQKNSINKRICFLQNNHIAVGDISTKEYQVFNPITGQQYINLVVSPDGSKIAFEVIGGNFYIMNVDGSGLVDLGDGHRPQWAPDSQYLIYMISFDDGHQFLSSDIFSIKIDGSEKTRRTFTDNKIEMNPSWSPDGTQIVYDVMDEGAIYVMSID